MFLWQLFVGVIGAPMKRELELKLVPSFGRILDL